MTPSLRDLVTVLYRPRETIRRILDAGPKRWTLQITILAFVCASVLDRDALRVNQVMPTLTTPSIILIALGGILAGALLWVGLLYFMGWLITIAGRILKGSATAADVRAALAWGMVPVIWSAIYRIPFAIYEYSFATGPRLNAREALMNYAASGGCVLIVVFLALQLLVCVWCLAIMTATLAEAQRFSIEKSLASIGITLVFPIVVIAALVFANHVAR